jgi:thiamineS protein
MLVRFFAAAEAAAGVGSAEIEAATVGELKKLLVARHGEGFEAVLGRCSLLVDGKAGLPDDYDLAGVGGVDVLPPFAGG